MNDKVEEFLSLATLLTQRKVSVAALATAIESHGVYCWDRFGRLKEFKSDSTEAGKALDLLAWEFAFDGDPLYERSPANEDDGDGNFHSYGWKQSTAPDFAQIEASQAETTQLAPPRQNKKSENADRAIIGALLMFIMGKLGNKPHPEYSTGEELIGVLTDKAGGYPGISKSNLETKFARGKEIFEPKP